VAATSGVYGLTLEKFFIDTLGDSLEAEDNNIMLTQSGYTPNFDTQDFRNDVTNESSGAGYSSGGKAFTGTEITLSGGVLTFDSADPSWAGASVTARGSVLYRPTGNAATDELFMAHTFGSDVTATAGTFTVAWNASGILTIDYTP
jgi:hypothetical protein